MIARFYQPHDRLKQPLFRHSSYPEVETKVDPEEGFKFQSFHPVEEVAGRILHGVRGRLR